MTTLTGELTTFVDVLGRRRGDDRILDAVVLVGPRMDVEEFDDDDPSVYYLFPDSGTEFLFQPDDLRSVSVRTGPDPDDPSAGIYPTPDRLIDQLGGDLTERAVTGLFEEEPVQTMPDGARYAHGTGFITFLYDAARSVRMIVVMADAPGSR